MPFAVPVQEGRLVRLRPLRASDATLIREAGHDPSIGWITFTHGAEDSDAKAYVERQIGRAHDGECWPFAIANVDTDDAIGEITLLRSIETGSASISCWIAREHRGHSYATAALSSLSTWAASLKLFTRLELYIEPHNGASMAAAEAAQYEREGLRQRWTQIVGEPRDVYVYARYV